MALIALVNLLMVIFDRSYIPFQDLYLRFLPEFTTCYGETFKGLEPHSVTTYYLETVDRLEERVSQAGLTSSEAQAILADLQAQSVDIVDEAPFNVANKSGTLELIKLKIRDRTGKESSTEAFNEFWSRSYLTRAGYAPELRFFNDDIQPLVKTNYYRGIGLDGGPIKWICARGRGISAIS